MVQDRLSIVHADEVEAGWVGSDGCSNPLEWIGFNHAALLRRGEELFSTTHGTAHGVVALTGIARSDEAEVVSNMLSRVKRLSSRGKAILSEFVGNIDRFPRRSGRANLRDQRDAGIELMQQQRFAEALPLFLRIIENEPDDWSLHYMAGQCYRFVGDISGAVKCLRTAASLNPSEPQVRLAMGTALKLAKEHGEAIEHFKRAVELDPTLFAAFSGIGDAYLERGQCDEALEWFAKAAEGIVDGVTEEVYRDKERCFMEKCIDGKKTLVLLPYAVEKTHEALRSNPAYAIVKNNMGVCLMGLGELDSARDQFRESVEFIPDGFDYPDPAMHLEDIG